MKTKLTESKSPAVACVILSSGFANVGNFVFFDSEADAEIFAEREDGRVVDEDGLAEKHEAMHCAEGRDPSNTYGGRHIEDQDESAEIWDGEYSEAAASDFRDATVHELEYEADKFSASVAENGKSVRVESDEDSDFWVLFEIDAERDNRLFVQERGPKWDDAAKDAATEAAESAMEESE